MLSLAIPAQAQDEGARAKALYQEARQLKREGRVRESLEKLKAVYELVKDDAILVSIANRHLDLGEPEEAATVLSLITSQSRAIRRQARRLRRDVERKLAEPVTVVIEADAPGATASIDGGPPRELPARVQLTRGTHRFVISAPDRHEVSIDRKLSGSVEIPLVVSLPPRSGRWRVAIEPAESLGDTRILLDGKAIVLTREERRVPVSEPRDIPPGSYKVTCLKGFEERVDAPLEVVTGAVAVATCRFDASTTGPIFEMDRRTMAWSSAGGAVVSLVAGVGYLVSYQDEKANYPPPRYEIDSTKPLAGGLLIATSVGLGALSYYLFTSP